jgi:hypothetical protein
MGDEPSACEQTRHLMNALTPYRDWGFKDEELRTTVHVCLMYNDEAARAKVLVPYLNAGLAAGELISYAADGAEPDQTQEWLRSIGVDLALEPAGSVNLVRADTFYRNVVRFDADKQLASMMDRFQAAERAGYTGSRACGEMSWALRVFPTADPLIAYESLINNIPTAFPHHGMCQYDARKFDGATLYRVLQVHPYIVANGSLVRNPFYSSTSGAPTVA